MSPCIRLPCLPSSSRPTGTPLPPPRPVASLGTHALHQSASRATLRGAQPEPNRSDTKASLFSKMSKTEDKDKNDAEVEKVAKDKKSKRDSSASGNGKGDGGAEVEGEGESMFTDPELVKYLFNPSGRLIPMSAPAHGARVSAGDVGTRKSGAGYIALPVYHAEPAVDAEKAATLSGKKDAAERAATEKAAVTEWSHAAENKERGEKEAESMGAEKVEALPTVRLVPRSERDAASVTSGSTAVAEVAGGEKGMKEKKEKKKAKKPSAWDTMGVIFT